MSNKLNFVVEETSTGGVTVVCMQCAHSVFGAGFERYAPSEKNKDFLRALNLPKIQCTRCLRPVKLD